MFKILPGVTEYQVELLSFSARLNDIWELLNCSELNHLQNVACMMHLFQFGYNNASLTTSESSRFGWVRNPLQSNSKSDYVRIGLGDKPDSKKIRHSVFGESQWKFNVFVQPKALVRIEGLSRFKLVNSLIYRSKKFKTNQGIINEVFKLIQDESKFNSIGIYAETRPTTYVEFKAIVKESLLNLLLEKVALNSSESNKQDLKSLFEDKWGNVFENQWYKNTFDNINWYLESPLSSTLSVLSRNKRLTDNSDECSRGVFRALNKSGGWPCRRDMWRYCSELLVLKFESDQFSFDECKSIFESDQVDVGNVFSGSGFDDIQGVNTDQRSEVSEAESSSELDFTLEDELSVLSNNTDISSEDLGRYYSSVWNKFRDILNKVDFNDSLNSWIKAKFEFYHDIWDISQRPEVQSRIVQHAAELICMLYDAYPEESEDKIQDKNSFPMPYAMTALNSTMEAFNEWCRDQSFYGNKIIPNIATTGSLYFESLGATDSFIKNRWATLVHSNSLFDVEADQLIRDYKQCNTDEKKTIFFDELRLFFSSAILENIKLELESTHRVFQSSEISKLLNMSLNPYKCRVNVIVTEFHPNNVAQSFQGRHPLESWLPGYMQHRTQSLSQPLILVLDLTCNTIYDDEVQHLLSDSSSWIDNGQLSIIMLQSNTKFSQGGLDFLSGAQLYFHGNQSRFSKFYRKKLSQYQVPFDTTTQRFFSEFKASDLEQRFLELIRGARLRFLRKLDDELSRIPVPRDDLLIVPATTTDRNLVVVALNLNESNFVNLFSHKLPSEKEFTDFVTNLVQDVASPLMDLRRIKASKRQSIGFVNPSINDCGRSIRLTCGVGDEDDLDALVTLISDLNIALYLCPDLYKLVTNERVFTNWKRSWLEIEKQISSCLEGNSVLIGATKEWTIFYQQLNFEKQIYVNSRQTQKKYLLSYNNPEKIGHLSLDDISNLFLIDFAWHKSRCFDNVLAFSIFNSVSKELVSSSCFDKFSQDFDYIEDDSFIFKTGIHNGCMRSPDGIYEEMSFSFCSDEGYIEMNASVERVCSDSNVDKSTIIEFTEDTILFKHKNSVDKAPLFWISDKLAMCYMVKVGECIGEVFHDSGKDYLLFEYI